MKIRFIYTALCFIALSGCLTDDGNYDYIDLDQVEQINGIDDFYSITKYEDVLSIQPQIDFKLGDTDNYEYEWAVNHWEYNEELRDRENFEIIISTDRDLEFVADHRVPYKDMFATYKVKNKETGVVYTHDFEIRIQNAYQYGYFFLCQKGEASEIFLVRDNGETIGDLFELLNGMPLKGKPYAMEPVKQGITFDVVAFTSAAPEYGAVMGIDNMDYKWGAINCFHDKVVGDNMVVDFFVAPKMADIYTIVNGNYYFTGRSAFGDYKPYIGIDVPDIDEKADYVDYMAMNNIYLHGTDPGTLYAPGSWGAISKVEIGGEPVVLPGKCYYMGPEPRNSLYAPTGALSHIFVMNEGVMTVTVMSAKMDFSTWETVYSIARKTTFPAPELITEDTKFMTSMSERYFFFSSANKIYRYNYDAPEDMPVAVVELPEGQTISYMYLDYTQEGWNMYDDKFVIGSYDDSGLTNGSVYFVNMDGTIDSKYENVCGKIVDMIVKK